MSATFHQAYKQLNPQQKKAVDAIDGPVMVVAGPGTGKTQVLATRIANILTKTDTNPRNILALTFTESAAKNMRERVVSLIGLTGYQVRIDTFHGFCRSVIENNPEYFSFSLDAEVITELEQFRLIQNILNQGKFYKLKPLKAPTLFVKSIIHAVSELKREGVDPEKFAQTIETEFADINEIKAEGKRSKLETQLAKNRELQRVYQLYEQNLNSTGRYDFNDMIMMVLQAFQTNKDLLLNYQEELHYFLVDEYQDTNSAQNQVVSLLASYWGEKANIFVVGDPHQSIFRFQGASLANISLFLDKYPKAKVVNLSVGYRCPQSIYDTAFRLMQDLDSENHESPVFKLLRFNQPIESAKKIDKSVKTSISLYEAPSQLAEYIYVAKKVSELIESGTDPSQIAVLYRNNVESLALMEVLDKWSINYDVAGGGNALEIEEIRQLLEFLRAIDSLRSGENKINLFEILSYDWIEFDGLLSMKLARLAGKKRSSLVDLIEGDDLTKASGQGVLKITPQDKLLAQQFLDQLRRFGQFDYQEPLVHFFEKVIDQTGYLEWLRQKPNGHELILALNSFFNTIKALNYDNHNFKLKDLLTALDLMQTYRLGIKVEDLNIKEGSVTLSTTHKAKGLEWDHVFLIGVIDRKWGNKRGGGTRLKLPTTIVETDIPQDDADAEERRLFYVALTRAGRQLYLSYPQSTVSQGSVKQHLPSQFVVFLKELKTMNLVDHQVDHEIEADLQKVLLPPPVKLTVKQDQRRFFQHLVDTFSLSISAMNKYLSSPKDFALDTLLRVPRAKAPNMGYGTAMHKVLELANRQMMSQGQWPTLDWLTKTFIQELDHELMAEAELERWRERGVKALTVYYQQRLLGDERVPLGAEKSFYKIYLDDIRLTGKVDRVDWLDKAKKWVRVVDYKTGKARSLNQIEAKTATAKQYLSPRELELPESLQGSYKRQLLFYKILTDLDQTFPYQAKQGSFDFVEPNSGGKLAKLRTFEFVDEEVELMKQLIKQVMGEIRNLEFLEFLESG